MSAVKTELFAFDIGNRVVITDPATGAEYVGTICMAAENRAFRLPNGVIHGASKCDWVIRLDNHVMAPVGEDRHEGMYARTRYACAPTSTMLHYYGDTEVA